MKKIHSKIKLIKKLKRINLTYLYCIVLDYNKRKTQFHRSELARQEDTSTNDTAPLIRTNHSVCSIVIVSEVKF